MCANLESGVYYDAALINLILVLHIYVHQLVHHWLDNDLLPASTKPLSKPMMTSHYSHPKEQTSIKDYLN